MKKVVILLTMVAFIAMGSVTMAEKKVNCCADGKVTKTTEKACAKKGGTVVKSAKECKSEKKQ